MLNERAEMGFRVVVRGNDVDVNEIAWYFGIRLCSVMSGVPNRLTTYKIQVLSLVCPYLLREWIL